MIVANSPGEGHMGRWYSKMCGFEKEMFARPVEMPRGTRHPNPVAPGKGTVAP